nr:MAG TPA: hypothetical protein [Caudoviricetes sp.]
MYSQKELFYKNLLTKVPYGCIIYTEVREKPETQNKNMEEKENA